MPDSKSKTKVHLVGAIVATLALFAITAIVLFLYAGHPLFERREYNIMVMSAFFAFISRLMLGVWMPSYFTRMKNR